MKISIYCIKSNLILNQWSVNTLIVILSLLVSGHCLPCQCLSTGHAKGLNLTLPMQCQNTHTSCDVMPTTHGIIWLCCMCVLSGVILCNTWLKSSVVKQCHLVGWQTRAQLSSVSVWNLHPCLISLGPPLRVQRQLCNAKRFSPCVFADELIPCLLSPSTQCGNRKSLLMYVMKADTGVSSDILSVMAATCWL